MRVRDALCCQPCGQSPRPLSIAAGGRAPSAIARQDRHSCQPSAWSRLRATAALRRHVASVSLPSSWRTHASAKAGARSPITGIASAHAAQYAAGAVRTALARPRPPSDAGRVASFRTPSASPAEAGLQGRPHGVVVSLGVAGYIQRRHRAERVVGPRGGATHIVSQGGEAIGSKAFVQCALGFRPMMR